MRQPASASGGMVHTELVALLLEKGAQVNRNNAFERYFDPAETPLQSAARLGKVRMGKLLIEHGATIDEQTSAMGRR